MSVEIVEMWFHKNIDPIVGGKRSTLKHIESWDSKIFFLGHLFHSNFPRLKSFDMTDKCHFCLTASCWAKSFVKTWMLPIFQCMEYKWLTGQKDRFLEKNLLFSKRALPYERFLFHRIQFDLQKGYRKLWCLLLTTHIIKGTFKVYGNF